VEPADQARLEQQLLNTSSSSSSSGSSSSSSSSMCLSGIIFGFADGWC